MRNLLTIALVGALTIFAAACSNSGETTKTTTNTATTTNSSGAAHNDAPGTAPSAHNETANKGAAPNAAAKDEVPAAVRAAFPDAQSITTQHKDMTAAQISSVEKETSTKVADKDHHSYLAFSTSGGARKQVGAATVVEAAGKQMVIVYESRNGVPYIREVRAEGVAQAFLDGFKGKGHDDKFQIGQDLKAQGVDEAMAKAAADAVRRDAVTMQTLYGGSHSH